MEPAWAGVIVSGVIQLVGIAYVTGRYSQMMADHGRRITELEENANEKIFPKLGELERRIDRIDHSGVPR